MHRLALQLGRTVGELENTLSYVELRRWIDYYALEPFGEWRADMHNAQLIKHVVDLHYWLAGQKNPHGLKDFMLFWRDKEPKRKTTEVQPDVPPQEGGKKRKVGKASVEQNLLTNLFLASALHKPDVKKGESKPKAKGKGKKAK